MAVFLQIAVFLQPLLPKQYQVAPVCETITHAVLQIKQQDISQHSLHEHSSMSQHQHNHAMQIAAQTEQKHHHDLVGHACQYCTVYGHLIMPPELEVKEVLDRIQIRLIAFQKTFKHVYFVLQRLFLTPQGRAPPVFA
ncbi:DUF2946 family protein [Acinetobacter stercoris]|nr:MULTISPECIES: DUF2946 family protein [Acinetobacter]